MRTIIAIGCAAIGAAILSFPALAQQKTVKACETEWRANKDANQAQGITLKAYVTQCRAGASAAQPSQPATTKAAAPAAAGQKTVKACRDEWRANKADNQAKGITEKAYVTQCRAGGTVAQPAPTPWLRHLPRPEPRRRRRRLHPVRRRRPGPDRRQRRRLGRTNTRPRRRPDSAAAQAPLSGPTRIQRSITSRATRRTARLKPAHTCANRMRPARECGRQKTKSVPERSLH